MTQHTPQLELKGMTADNKAALIDHDGGLIEVYGTKRQELSAHIVKCVNAHDALVSALKHAERVMSLTHCLQADHISGKAHEGSALEAVRAALKLAGEA